MRELIAFNSIEGKYLSKLIYSGELFDSVKASELGIIDEVFEVRDLESIAIEKILTILGDDPMPFD